MQPRYIECRKNLESTIGEVKDWHYAYLYSSETVNRTNFYAGMNYCCDILYVLNSCLFLSGTGFSKVYRLQNSRWVKVKDLELITGTLLFGEFVKETSLLKNDEIITKYSLHVLDAAYLGSMDLQSFTFQERYITYFHFWITHFLYTFRQKFIHIFCKAVNKESQSKYSVRVRPKVIKKLAYLPQDFSLSTNDDAENFSITLPRIGYNSVCEQCEVNSILLLKTNNCK